MDTEESGEQVGRTDRERCVTADELQDFLGGVHFAVGEESDASTRSWPGHDRPAIRRKPAGPSVEVFDHVELGRLIAEWASDPASRPSGGRELASQLRGVAKLPEGIRTVSFVQDPPEQLTIRLPAVDALEADLTELADPSRADGCPVPHFYSDGHSPGIGPVLTPVDMFLARLGDLSLGAP